ncbi:MAG: DNA integrity scanning protein DisA nucleotide-binding domain protein, partial [Roseibacillus sp.]|nr:DNA integrity scanning protein DisA nucleotide-binding domain protein [Roseibacillus sp.]
MDTGIYAWDHHWGIFPHLDIQLPIYDNSYSALLNDLDADLFYRSVQDPARYAGSLLRLQLAAVGVTLESDCVAVVVSEETGAISIAASGRLFRDLSPAAMRSMLLELLRP